MITITSIKNESVLDKHLSEVSIRATKKDGVARGSLGKSAWGDVHKHGRGSRRSAHSAK